MSARWRYLGAAAGLASLWLFYYWTQVLTYRPQHMFTLKTPPGRETYAGLILVSAVLAGLFYLWMITIDKLDKPAARRILKWLFLVLLLVPLNSLRDTLAIAHPVLGAAILRKFSPPLVWGAVTAAAIVFAAASAFQARRMYRAAVFVLWFFWPVALICVGQAGWKLIRPIAEFPDKPPAQRNAGNGGGRPRVVAVVLDEWDYRLTFEARPGGLELPELDRLRAESLFATKVSAPSTSTVHSISTLLAGRDVTEVKFLGPSEMDIRLKGSRDWLRWEQAVTLFREAKAAGADSALAGWYLPYCRAMGDQLVDCWWDGLPRRISSLGASSLEVTFNLLRASFESSLLSPFGQSLSTKRTAAMIQEMERISLGMVGDPRTGLVFLHLIPPHAPHSYDRRTGKFELSNAPLTGYYDSLVLADRTVGRILAQLRETGLDDHTHLLVTADHSYRTASGLGQPRDYRVPWILRLAGQHEAMTIDRSFEWVRTHDLILDLLAGRARTPEEAMVRLGIR